MIELNLLIIDDATYYSVQFDRYIANILIISNFYKQINKLLPQNALK